MALGHIFAEFVCRKNTFTATDLEFAILLSVPILLQLLWNLHSDLIFSRKTRCTQINGNFTKEFFSQFPYLLHVEHVLPNAAVILVVIDTLFPLRSVFEFIIWMSWNRHPVKNCDLSISTSSVDGGSRSIKSCGRRIPLNQERWTADLAQSRGVDGGSRSIKSGGRRIPLNQERCHCGCNSKLVRP
jgi:hypothetical protein